MAALGQSRLIAITNSGPAEEDVRSSSTEACGRCRISSPSSCSGSRSVHSNDLLMYTPYHSGLLSTGGRKRNGLALRNRVYTSVSGVHTERWQGYGVARAGMEDGGQVVTPATALGADELSVSDPEMLLHLHLQLKVATVREDYVEAARLRDMVNVLQGKDPVLRVKAMMEKAIAEERYTDAAKYREDLRRLAPEKLDAGLKCFSDTTTKGIRVRVRSVYVSDRSQPCKCQYFFAYRIRISNESLQAVQLLSRHWFITDATGNIKQARGLGVNGEQPVLLPGTSFEYTSACPLGTSTGKMEGDYQMKYPDEKSPATFDVKIGPFFLSLNGDEWVD